MNYNDYELCYMIRESEDALSFLLKKYEPLFLKLSYSLISTSRYSIFDVDDLMQQCRISTCYAIDKYNFENDVLFYSYLLVCLKRGLYSIIKGKKIDRETSLYLDYDNYDKFTELSVNDSSFSLCVDKDFDDNITLFKHSLKSIDSFIFELRLNGFKYSDISCLLDIDIKKVDNSLQSTRKKLEKYLLF